MERRNVGKIVVSSSNGGRELFLQYPSGNFTIAKICHDDVPFARQHSQGSQSFDSPMECSSLGNVCCRIDKKPYPDWRIFGYCR